jgi:hypothetical protein
MAIVDTFNYSIFIMLPIKTLLVFHLLVITLTQSTIIVIVQLRDRKDR